MPNYPMTYLGTELQLNRSYSLHIYSHAEGVDAGNEIREHEHHRRP